MEIKIIEIRDRGTYIPVMAIKMQSDNPAEQYHLKDQGYSEDYPCIMVVRMEKGHIATYNAFDYNDRTMHNAHLYIKEHYDELVSGDVVDVEYILGETEKPKVSQNPNIDMVDYATQLLGYDVMGELSKLGIDK